MKLEGKLILIAAVSLVLMGCPEVEEFPSEPSIEFVSLIRNTTDSATLTFSFTDGDGDIGLSDSDTTGSFAPGEPFHHNLFIEYFELQNGDWTLITLPLPYRYRIPRITPTGQNKLLEGSIDVALAPFPTDPNSAFDTVKYSIQLADRALNLSNVVESSSFVVE